VSAASYDLVDLEVVWDVMICHKVSTFCHITGPQCLIVKGFSVQGSQRLYGGADKSLAQPTSRCILFDGENILFDASLVKYINSNNILPIIIINRMCELQNHANRRCWVSHSSA
jgi:hypothetical protein